MNRLILQTIFIYLLFLFNFYNSSVVVSPEPEFSIDFQTQGCNYIFRFFLVGPNITAYLNNMSLPTTTATISPENSKSGEVILKVSVKTDPNTSGSMSISITYPVQVNVLNFYSYNCFNGNFYFQSLQSNVPGNIIKRKDWSTFFFSYALLASIDPTKGFTGTPYQNFKSVGSPRFFSYPNITYATTYMNVDPLSFTHPLDPSFLDVDYETDIVNIQMNAKFSGFGTSETPTFKPNNFNVFYFGWNQILVRYSVVNTIPDFWIGFFNKFDNILGKHYLTERITTGPSSYSNVIFASIPLQSPQASNIVAYNEMDGSYATLDVSSYPIRVVYVDPTSSGTALFEVVAGTVILTLTSAVANDFYCESGLNGFVNYVPFPYGYTVTDVSTVYSVSIPTTLYWSPYQGNLYAYKCYSENSVGDSLTATPPIVTPNTQPPLLLDYKITKLDKYHLLVSLTLSANSGGNIDTLQFGNQPVLQAYEFLQSGSLSSQAVLEIPLTLNEELNDLPKSVRVVNTNGIIANLGTFIYYYPTQGIVGDNFYVPSFDMNPNKFTYFKFLENLLNIPKPSPTQAFSMKSNTLFFNIEGSTPDLIVGFSLVLPLNKDVWYWANWNEDLELFVLQFNIPYNLNPGTLFYKMCVNFKTIFSEELIPFLGMDGSELTVTSQSGSQMPPYIKSVRFSPETYAPIVSEQTFSFIIEIESANGLADGNITVSSKEDRVGYSFRVFPTSMYFVSGNKYSATYELQWLVENGCQSTTYTITYASFIDQNGFETNSFDYTKINPIFNIVGTENFSLPISCVSTLDSIPQLVSLTKSPDSIMYDGTIDSRRILFTFEANSSSGIGKLIGTQNPKLYLSDGKRILSYDARPTNIVGVTGSYKVDCIIPIGFGYNNGISVSIYGITNTNFYTKGYSTDELRLLLGLETSYIIVYENYESTFAPVISTILPYTIGQSSITIVASYINNTQFETQIIYRNNVTQTISYNKVSKLSESTFSISSINTQLSNLPFDVSIKLVSNSNHSPKYYVVPLPSQSITFVPTPMPINCPVCANGGTCNQSTKECVCPPPWTGADCSTKPVIFTQPTKNTTNPDFKANITNEQNDKYFCKVGVIMIREVNITGDIVTTINLQNQVWNFIPISNNESLYYYEFINNNITSQINITTKWFKQSTVVKFAGEEFNMSPSSYKYSISMNTFGFKSKLNKLQVIFESGLDLEEKKDQQCSSKALSKDSAFIYTKLAINDMVLLGRFINVGVLDGRNTLLSNSPLNLNEKGSINSTNMLIAIEIPNFDLQAKLDPDFSVLISSKPVNEKTTSSTCSKSSTSAISTSGLSKTQLIGIIIGAVAGGIIFISLITYVLFKKFKYSPAMLSIRSKF